MSMWPIEKRCARRDTRAFVTKETVDLLAEKLIGIVADRRVVKIHRYLRNAGGPPDVYPGLRVDRAAHGDGVSRREGQSVSLYLSGQSSRSQAIGFGVWRQDEDEEKAALRYDHPEDQWLGERRDIILVEMRGWPGSPGREDRIRIEKWNEHGVGQEDLITFDDIDPVQEIAWDVKGDRERRMHLYDAFCDDHAVHFEHPDRDSRGCKGCRGRQSTLAENLAVLAVLAKRAEEAA